MTGKDTYDKLFSWRLKSKVIRLFALSTDPSEIYLNFILIQTKYIHYFLGKKQFQIISNKTTVQLQFFIQVTTTEANLKHVGLSIMRNVERQTIKRRV